MSSPNTQEYALATAQWKSTANIFIHLQSGRAIAHFPLEFLRRGGDHSWPYIFYVLKEMLELDERDAWTVIDEDAQPIDQSAIPVEGSYQLMVRGEHILR